MLSSRIEFFHQNRRSPERGCLSSNEKLDQKHLAFRPVNRRWHFLARFGTFSPRFSARAREDRSWKGGT
jgi:hypothetical protein